MVKKIMREKMFNRIAVMLLLLMVSGVFAIAQNTTSTIVGTVSDAEDNLPGAIVKVTEIETGTVYVAVSNSKGQFRINGVQPGGPYRMEVSFVGHKKGVIKITRVNLGQTYSCDVTLRLVTNCKKWWCAVRQHCARPADRKTSPRRPSTISLPSTEA